MDELMSRSELTVAECDELRSIALAMPVENIPVETQELAKQLQFIEATLPSKNTDEQSGQMRTAVYARILGGYTKKVIPSAQAETSRNTGSETENPSSVLRTTASLTLLG